MALMETYCRLILNAGIKQIMMLVLNTICTEIEKGVNFSCIHHF